jgi:polyribonucleotide nucleotidyltransferase
VPDATQQPLFAVASAQSSELTCAGVSIGAVAEQTGQQDGRRGLRWELLSDAASLEETLGSMQLSTAGTRAGFTMLQLTSCMAGTVVIT